jgi:hypothetical protein
LSRQVDAPSTHGDDSWGTSSNLITKKLLGLGKTLGDKDEVNFIRYSRVVQEYCRKRFTFADDIPVAFAGIEAAMEKLYGWTVAYGLPEQILDRVLLWEPEERRYSYESFPMRSCQRGEVTESIAPCEKELRSSEIPSWSWSAWTGSVCLRPVECISPSSLPYSFQTWYVFQQLRLDSQLIPKF